MLKMKKVFAIVLTLGLTTPVVAGCGLVVKTEEAKQRDIDKVRNIVLAEGTGIKVTYGPVLDQYNRVLESYKAQLGEEGLKQYGPMLEQQKIAIMDNMLNQQVVDKKADEKGLKVDTPEIKAEAAKIMEANEAKAGGKEKFEESIKALGLTRASYQEEISKGLRRQQFMDSFTKDLKVQDQEIATHYEKNKANYKKEAGATISHIFFGKADDTAAQAKAKEAKAKLDGGAKFEDIAKAYGKDGSAAQGGLLGTYPWNTTELGADFMALAQKVPEGKYSGPVKSSFGWHIIKVTDITQAKQLTLADETTDESGQKMTLKQEISNTLLAEKKKEKEAAMLDQWEKELAVKRYPERIPMEFANQENPSNASQGVETKATTK